MKPASGAKSTEFWVVAAFLGDLLFQRIGLYDFITLEQLSDVTAQVRAIADQIKGETGSDSSLIYLLGAVYVGGRTWLKGESK
jgi:hypothetical protein